MDIDRDSAQVRIPPPFFLLVAVLIGAGLHWFYPVRLASPPWRWILAVFFIAAGVFIVLHSAVLFKRAKTDIKPWKTTTRLVDAGFYRISRNPIYLAFVIVALGLAFAINSLWVVVMIVPLIVVLDRYVILKEERYLEEKFGEDYRAYRKRVRRWI